MIYYLVPLYNEEANIPKLHAAFMKEREKYPIYFVFVDDCSSDSTVDLVRTTFGSDECTVLTKEQNVGPGHSFNMGFEWILERCDPTDSIVTLEGDGTSDLAILPAMLDLSVKHKYDLVLASVYAQGGGFEKTSFFRVLISFVANLTMRSIFGIKVLTLSSFYRIYRAEILAKIKAEKGHVVAQAGFICMLEALLNCIQQNASVIEVPMTLKSEERIGKSKMKVMKTSMDYLKFLLSRK